MDHPFEPDRQVAQRRGRPDGERLEELARQFHLVILICEQVREQVAPLLKRLVERFWCAKPQKASPAAKLDGGSGRVRRPL